MRPDRHKKKTSSAYKAAAGLSKTKSTHNSTELGSNVDRYETGELEADTPEQSKDFAQLLSSSTSDSLRCDLFILYEDDLSSPDGVIETPGIDAQIEGSDHALTDTLNTAAVAQSLACLSIERQLSISKHDIEEELLLRFERDIYRATQSHKLGAGLIVDHKERHSGRKTREETYRTNIGLKLLPCRDMNPPPADMKTPTADNPPTADSVNSTRDEPPSRADEQSSTTQGLHPDTQQCEPKTGPLIPSNDDTVPPESAVPGLEETTAEELEDWLDSVI